MNVDQQLDKRQAQRMAAEDRYLQRLDSREKQAARDQKETIEAMKNWCMENYDNGADTMVECWTDKDYARLFVNQNNARFMSERAAWKLLKDLAAVYADRQADARNSAF